MHIRISSVTRNGKTYRYAQLVETFRRPADGMPAHRVIATLGPPDNLETENLRAALAAAREGKRVAVSRQPRTTGSRPLKPSASLRYLDLAVLLQLWRDAGLEELLTESMARGDGLVPPASVVAALVLQRCVDPGSKLFASRWMPRTALPELLAIAPEQFNNTRVHRVLEDLDGATTSVMAKLPQRYVSRDGAFASLFLDVSDTWFVGDGPSLASRSKTKEGRIERKVGIVLLCNQDGLPVRWDVIPGAQADQTAMTRMLRAVAGVSWAAQVPIVCDRAMGTTAMIGEMVQTGLRFVTALTKTEFDGYAPTLPHTGFSALTPDEARREVSVKQAADQALAAGMKKHTDNLYVLDLGIVDRACSDTLVSESCAPLADRNAEAMRIAREIDEAVDHGRFASHRAAGRALGLKRSLVTSYMRLRRLTEQQQREVLDGKLAHATLAALQAVAAIESPEERAPAFDLLVERPTPSKRFAPAARRRPRPRADGPSLQSIRVRAVAYFNPERFVEQRLVARRGIEAVEAFVVELRAKVAASPRRYTLQQLHGLIDRELRARSVLDVFDVRVSPSSNGFDIAVVLDSKGWALRRRYDGFTVLIAHPDVPIDAAELCALYRAKDAVEKDFQIIKSVVQLRPVWHQTDAKVRAHVTICMLALLLQRMLSQRMRELQMTEAAALEVLAECRLNRYAGNNGPALYTITTLDSEQQAVLRALRLLHLADDDVLAERIRPR